MAVMEERKSIKLFIDVPQICRCCYCFFFFTEIGELPAQLDLMKKTIIRLVFDLNQIKIIKKGNCTATKWPMLADPFNSFTVALVYNPL